MRFHQAEMSQRQPVTSGLAQKQHTAVPSSVPETVQSTGRPLDAQTRAQMESRFGRDFSQVRVHTDEQAAASATAVKANAYTVQNDIVFGAGQYQPQSSRGQHLLAHELTHVVQQQQAGSQTDSETRAESAATRVMQGLPVTQTMVGQAGPGLHKQESDEGTDEPAAERPAAETTPAFSLRWLDLARIGAFQLTPPALLQPQPGFSPGSVSLSPQLQAPLLNSPTAPSGTPRLPPPVLLPPTPDETSTTPDLTTPAPTNEGDESGSGDLPSRLSVTSFGSFSLGLRLGLPEVDLSSPEGFPPSALRQSLQQATIINQTLTGNIPTGWDAVDKGLLARAVWGIISTNIAPDLTRSITDSLTTSTDTGGTSFELDMALITNFSNEIGGGLSFTIRH